MRESAGNSSFQEILIEKNFPFETRRKVCGTDEHRGTGKIEHEADRRLLCQLLQGVRVSRINIRLFREKLVPLKHGQYHQPIFKHLVNDAVIPLDQFTNIIARKFRHFTACKL